MADVAKVPISEEYQAEMSKLFLSQLNAKQGSTLVNKIAMVRSSTSASNRYDFFDGVASVTKLVGNQNINKLTKSTFTIANEAWYLNHGFDEIELQDNPEVVQDMMPSFAESASEHPDQLLLSVMAANPVCYDGLTFFNTAHIGATGTYSNSLTGTSALAAGVKADLDLANQAFKSFKKENGVSIFGFEKLELVVIHSSEMESVMVEVLDREQVTGATGKNGHYKFAEHYGTPALTGNSYYIFVVNRAFKPFIYQTRIPMKMDWDMTLLKRESKAFFIGKGRYNIGVGLPQLAIKVTNS